MGANNNNYEDIFSTVPKSGESEKEWLRRVSEGKNYRTVARAWYDYKDKFNYIFVDSKKEVEVSTKDIISKDKAISALKTEISVLNKKYKECLYNISELEGRNSIIDDIQSSKLIHYIEFNTNDKKESIKIPLIQWSDFHLEETVDSSVVSGLNEYNPSIAEKRFSEKLIPNTISYIQDIRSNAIVDTIYICLNGDMISGYIHDDLRESNTLSPTEAILRCERMIISGLLELKNKLSLKKIIVQGNFGNHGRTTKETRHATAYKNSYEWLMLKHISDRLSEDSVFEVHVSNGIFSYYTFTNSDGKTFTIRSWHGDNIKYNGGVGGITIPINKMLLKLDQTMYANYNFVAHFHQLFEAHKKVLVNGSLIGYNSFAHNLGFEYEKPQQGMVVLNVDEMRIESKFNILCE